MIHRMHLNICFRTLFLCSSSLHSKTSTMTHPDTREGKLRVYKVQAPTFQYHHQTRKPPSLNHRDTASAVRTGSPTRNRTHNAHLHPRSIDTMSSLYTDSGGGQLPSIHTSSDENVCRICRGEGSRDNPLFYPCKCRGSIKYIHQGCLEEWLERSRRDQTCDICHEKYRFTTVYLENTPDRVPIVLILKRIAYYVYQFGKYSITLFGLVFGVGIQVPLFFEFLRRLMNIIVDSKTHRNDILLDLLYGDEEFEGNPYGWKNLFATLSATYLRSALLLIILLAVHLVLFLEHDWVSRDPGFKKLVNRNVGRIISFKDLFRGPIQDEQIEQLVNAALEEQREQQGGAAQRRPDLRAERDHPILRRNARQDGEEHFDRDELDFNYDDNDDDDNSDEDPDFQPNENEASSEDETDNELDHSDLEQDEEEGFRNNIVEQVQHNRAAAGPNQDEIPILENPDAPAEPLPPFPFPIRPAQVQAQPRAQAQPAQQQPAFMNGFNDQAVAAAAGVGDGLLPVHIIIVAADTLLAVYLTFAYLFPYSAGNLIFHLLAFAFEPFTSIVPSLLSRLKVLPYLIQLLNGLNYLKKYNSDFDQFLDNHVIGPFSHSISKIYHQNEPLTTYDRFIPFFLFYGLVFSAILKYLAIKEKNHDDRNPLKGLQRTIYVLLFDFTCTLKVFLIFGIELVVFPTICGLLIEFVLTPFYDSEAKLVLSIFPFVKDYIFARIVANWSIGTLYMCLFALFVGMTRRYILRPGVLFFIRSPEDPNARLVHDALVRPLSLQVSRIGLSGFVYTLFILIGFGVVSYGLRLMESPLIPIHFKSITPLLYAQYAYHTINENQELLKKYIRQYWFRAFKSACTQTRLSSFILGIHNPKERGCIVYKSFFSRFKKDVKPDYSQPKLYSEAMELFKDPSTTEGAYFIPDGNLIRAPKSDIVSKKFVSRLFISVTKDDIPLKSKYELAKDFSKVKIDEFDESEDELTTTNQYEIVYRPPHFGFRIILFILMLWVFSVILIVGVGLVANFLGRPLIILHYLLLSLGEDSSSKLVNVIVSFMNALDDPTHNYWTLQLDFHSISIGLFIICKLLKMYDEYLIKKHMEAEGDEVVVDDRASFLSRIFDEMKVFFPILSSLVLRMVTFSYLMTWNYLIHTYAIDRPYNYYYGIDTNPYQFFDIPVNFTFNGFTLFVHALVFFQNNQHTLKNHLLQLDLRIFNGAQPDILQSSVAFFKYGLKIFASTHLIVILFKLGLSIYEFLQNGQDYNGYIDVLSNVALERIYLREQVYIWPLVLFISLIIKNYKSSSAFLKKVNNEVKEQYYSKGKTLENTVLDEETDLTPSLSE